MDDEIEKAIGAAKPAPCGIHCTVCEGSDHHWLPDCDEDTGEPIMVCKHCDATTEYFDEDDEDDYED